MPFSFYNYDDLYYVCQRCCHYIPPSYYLYEDKYSYAYLDVHLFLDYDVEGQGLNNVYHISCKSLLGCYIIHKLKQHLGYG